MVLQSLTEIIVFLNLSLVLYSISVEEKHLIAEIPGLELSYPLEPPQHVGWGSS